MSSKFWMYIALCVSLIYYSAATVTNPCLEELGEGEYAIYSHEDITSSLVTRRVFSGIGYIYYSNARDAATLRKNFSSIDGESITLSSRFTASDVFKKLGYREVGSDGMIFYGYSPHGKAFIKNGQQKINLQIAERNGTTVVGWPVILGSY